MTFGATRPVILVTPHNSNANSICGFRYSCMIKVKINAGCITSYHYYDYTQQTTILPKNA